LGIVCESNKTTPLAPLLAKERGTRKFPSPLLPCKREGNKKNPPDSSPLQGEESGG